MEYRINKRTGDRTADACVHKGVLPVRQCPLVSLSESIMINVLRIIC